MVALMLVLGACGSKSVSESSQAASSATASSAQKDSMWSKRYCEVLEIQLADGHAGVEVYNSFPLNDCPEQLWTKLDTKAIAAESGVNLAVLNGPRYWLMDSVEKAGGSTGLTKIDFGGIQMYRQASVAISSLADASKPYSIHEVDRSAYFTFDAGRTVYELIDPAGVTYVMQSWSQQQVPALSESDLAGLGSRLALPAGWSYRSRVLEAPLSIDTRAAKARVIQDELGNSYSQRSDI